MSHDFRLDGADGLDSHGRVESVSLRKQGIFLAPRARGADKWLSLSLLSLTQPQQRFLSPIQTPRRWDWRDHIGFSTVPDQRPHNSCLSHAICAIAEAKIQIASRSSLRMSPRYFHFHDLGLAADTGTGVANCESAGINVGLPCWVDGADQITSIEDCNRLQRPRRQMLREISNCSSIQEIKQEICTQGPVLCGVQAYQDFDSFQGEVYRPTTRNGRYAHAMALIGYDDDNRYWIMRNSYGENWGGNNHGYCYYDMEAADLSAPNPNAWAVRLS